MTALQTTKPKSDIYGIAIGGTVGMFIMSIGPITGACLNPQRMFGPSWISGEFFESTYEYAWIYYVGNYLGGALAGLLWYFVFVDWNGNELQKKEEHEMTEGDRINEYNRKMTHPYPHSLKKKNLEVVINHEAGGVQGEVELPEI